MPHFLQVLLTWQCNVRGNWSKTQGQRHVRLLNPSLPRAGVSNTTTLPPHVPGCEIVGFVELRNCKQEKNREETSFFLFSRPAPLFVLLSEAFSRTGSIYLMYKSNKERECVKRCWSITRVENNSQEKFTILHVPHIGFLCYSNWDQILLYGRWLESKDEYMYFFMKFC